MFSLFKDRMTADQAAMVLSEVTHDIRSNYLQRVFSDAYRMPK